MTPDIADIIAGELKVSRGTAYDMMREALKKASPVHCARCAEMGYETPPAPQPLNAEEVKALTREAGYDKASAFDLANFINGIRYGEAAHGITGKTT